MSLAFVLYKVNMRLALVWNFSKAPEIYKNWRDGLRGAIEHIGIDHEVDIYLGDKYKEFEDNYDAILLWSDSNDGIIDWAEDKKGKKGMVLTTDPMNVEKLKKLDVIFCESKPVYEAVRRHGLHGVLAFGTDTDFYRPDASVKKDIPYFYPATFSPWKRQDEIAHLGKDLYCVGTVQPDGQEIYQKCLSRGVNCAVGYFKATHIARLYQRAQKVIIPAIHGSERTVLEAMATGILPAVINPQNIRARSYLKEFEEWDEVGTCRQFVEARYSHRSYAVKICKYLL